MFAKHKPVRDSIYLDWVRSHPCCSCLRPAPSDPHHFMEQGGGTGLKCDDHFRVPLCRECHMQWHAKGRVGSLDREQSVSAFYKKEAQLLSAWLRQLDQAF